MISVLSLVVCLAGQPAVCETVVPDYAHADTGQGPTFFECLGHDGQDILRKFLAEHPTYGSGRVQCSVASGRDAGKLRDRIDGPRA